LAGGLDRDNPVSYEDVEEASGRVKGHALRTPLTRSAALSRETGREIWLKQENLQHTGSFKPRGALSRIGLMGQEEKARGVVAHRLATTQWEWPMRVRCWRCGKPPSSFNPTPPRQAGAASDYPVEVHLISGTFEAAQQAALDRSRRSQPSTSPRTTTRLRSPVRERSEWRSPSSSPISTWSWCRWEGAR